MSEQICDICKKEPVRIHIEGQGNYCLKCYNTMILERIGVDDTFQYPNTMAVREPNGNLHIFRIEHMIIIISGRYQILSQMAQLLLRDFSERLLKGSVQKACANLSTVLITCCIVTGSILACEIKEPSISSKMRIVVIGLDLKLMGSSSVERIWKSY